MIVLVLSFEATTNLIYKVNEIWALHSYSIS